MSGRDTQSLYTPELLDEYTIGFLSISLCCILYGIYIIIAGANLSLLCEKKYKILLSFTLLQLVATTFYLAISLYSGPTQLLSIFDLFGTNSFNAVSPWNDTSRDASFLVNTWTSDAFLLYRCHVIWKGKKCAAVLPALIYLATFGASIAWLIVGSIPGTVHSTPANQLGGIIVFSCSVAMNVTASALISGRLLYYRHAISQAAGSQQGRFYLSYLAMTLESAMLYTVFVIITLAVFSMNSLLLNIFFAMLGIVQVIAPSLIVNRIARGISFETDDYGSRMLSTLDFVPGPGRRQTSLDGVSNVTGTLHVSGRSTKSLRGVQELLEEQV